LWNIEKGYRLVRVKTSITMDKEFLAWIKEKIEERVFANKSHAIEYAVKKLMDQEKKQARA
jgi:Arc/MetJ-type ribon-helix-helix transcriptional regulator